MKDMFRQTFFVSFFVSSVDSADCSVVNSVSIDDDVLAEVSFAGKTVGVWWGWLVDGPVVEWWVLDWVSNLDEGGAVESGGGIVSGVSGSVDGDIGLGEGSGVGGVVSSSLG